MFRRFFHIIAVSLAAAGLTGSTAWAQEKPEAILVAAKKACDAQPWVVAAHVNAKNSMKISGIIFGKDFDLTVETVDGERRLITLGEKNWSSDDGGKTWKSIAAPDRRFYFLVHTPIKSSPEEKIPPFEKVGSETLGGAPLTHIRFIAPEKVQYEGDRPNYWITSGSGAAPIVKRYMGPAAFDNDYVDDRVEYTAYAEKNPILPPPGNPRAAAPPPGPERMLMTAMKKMATGVWEVKGTATFKKTIKVFGLLEGENFDLTMDPGVQPDIPARQIVIGNKAWVCSDGKTWHSGSTSDRMIYNLSHTPILSGRLEPAFEEIGREQRNGATWLHIRLQVAEAKVDPKSLPQYWLVLDPQEKPLYIGRAELPAVSRGTTDVTLCAFDYAPAKSKITPPPADAMKAAPVGAAAGSADSAPVDDVVHGFKDIEAHKAEWDGKIVRVEVTPKLLQAVEIAKGSYRVMLKDTSDSAISYGQVDFPGQALVSLGFLKKAVTGNHTWVDLQKMGVLGRTEGAPVSFYLRVVNQGEKPAARCVAVGSKYGRGQDGQAAYSW